MGDILYYRECFVCAHYYRFFRLATGRGYFLVELIVNESYVV